MAPAQRDVTPETWEQAQGTRWGGELRARPGHGAGCVAWQ